MSRALKAALAAATALLVLAVGVTVGVIAAGGSSDEANQASDRFQQRPDADEPGPGPRLFAPDPEALEDFRECLQERGVEVPEPGSDPPPDFDRDELQKAFEACRDELPSDIRPPSGGLQ
jgi:hypothetical protein